MTGCTILTNQHQAGVGWGQGDMEKALTHLISPFLTSDVSRRFIRVKSASVNLLKIFKVNHLDKLLI
jgi:hypothetical protein